MSPRSEHTAPPAGKGAPRDRIGGFARYFKGYMAASAVVTAALPVPVAAFRLVPAYAEQRAFLGVYTSLFAFLVLAFLFYSRHWIARDMFAMVEPGVYRTRAMAAWFPLVLVCCSLAAVFCYHAMLGSSIRDRSALFSAVQINVPPQKILTETAASDIPRAALLIVLYLAIFLFAEAAFVVMALREYMQDILGISDRDLVGPPAQSQARN